MARLPVRSEPDANTGVLKVDVATAIQRCLRDSRSRRIASRTAKLTIAVGNVLILVLVKLLNLANGASYTNKGLIYGILALSSLNALV